MLRLKSVVIVATLWEGPLPLESLSKFYDQNVIMGGASIFRPSGTLLRVDADAIALARRNLVARQLETSAIVARP